VAGTSDTRRALPEISPAALDPLNRVLSDGWWGSQMSVCHGPHLPPESTSNALATANRLRLPVDLSPRPRPICTGPADLSVMKGRLYFGKEILCFSAICSAIAFGKISK